MGERLAVLTSAGPMAGLWRGRHPVGVGDELHFEMELENPRDWSEIGWRRVGGHSKVAPSSSPLWIEGTVTDFDQNGVLTLDVAGTPLMIDTTGEPPLGVVGLTVRVAAQDLQFFPVEV
jgi:hypothetical protein